MSKDDLYRILLRWFGPAVRKYARLDVVGIERVPEPGEPLILVCHHPGSLWWDAICLAAALPQRQIRFVAQHWDSQQRLLNGMLRRVGALYQSADVDDIDSGDEVAQALELGQTVCVYPEQSYHTFWRRYTLFAFAAHALRYAEVSRAQVVPVAIIGAEEAAPTLLGWKKRGMPFHFPVQPPLVLPCKITIEFGPAKTFKDLTKSFSQDSVSDAYETGAEELRSNLAEVIRRHRPCQLSDQSYIEHNGWW